MILYVNGDSHTYGSDAGGPEFSYGSLIAKKLGYGFMCDAIPGASNARVLRTTEEYLARHKPDLLIIGWTTWERQEWAHQGQYYSVSYNMNTNILPKPLQEKYREWIISVDDKHQADQEHWCHEKIWALHQKLLNRKIPHLFFNCYLYFTNPQRYETPKFDWGMSYLGPYTQDETYYYWLENQGFLPVATNSQHYGPDAHQAWANHLIPYLTRIL